MNLLLVSHASAALVAWMLGGWQLFLSTKGSPAHRLVGVVWVVLALHVAITGFWIKEIRPGEFSFLHVFSVITLVSVPLGIVAIVRGNVRAHRGNMTGVWVGMTFALLFAVVVPDRMIPTFVVDEPAGAVAAFAALVATVVAVVGGAIALERRAHPLRAARAQTVE